MTRDLVKRLAIQSGIDLEFFQAGELFSFASAIANHAVDDYKAGLVPVATTYISSSGYMEAEFKGTIRSGTDLYALPSGEAK